MNFIYYPYSSKLYNPGILLNSDSGFQSLSSIKITNKDNNELYITGDFLYVTQGIPRILSKAETAYRLLTTNRALKQLYSNYQDYKSQAEIYKNITKTIGDYSGQFIIDEFIGYEPLLIINESDKEYQCLRSINFTKTFHPVLDIRYIPKDIKFIDEENALIWLWTNLELKEYAVKEEDKYKFVTNIINNFK